jgi:hypothetical protein
MAHISASRSFILVRCAVSFFAVEQKTNQMVLLNTVT